jgi:hypothetical protein
MRPRPMKPETSLANRERRASPRVSIRAAVTVVEGTERICGWVRNLSIGGLFVETDAPPAINTEVRVEMLLREGYAVRRLRAEAWVAWVGAGGMGLQFDALTPDDVDLIVRTLRRFG